MVIQHNGQDFVVGVSSYGPIEGCAVGHPVAYTRVPSYLNWIEETKKKILEENRSEI